MRGWHSDQIEKHCIDVLPACLIDACVLFFQLNPSTEARVSSIVDNNLFLVAAVLLCTFRDPATLSRQSAERRECLDLIQELLVRVSTKATQLRSTVYRELTTAAFLAVALQNVHLGRDWTTVCATALSSLTSSTRCCARRACKSSSTSAMFRADPGLGRGSGARSAMAVLLQPRRRTRGRVVAGDVCGWSRASPAWSPHLRRAPCRTSRAPGRRARPPPCRRPPCRRTRRACRARGEQVVGDHVDDTARLRPDRFRGLQRGEARRVALPRRRTDRGCDHIERTRREIADRPLGEHEVLPALDANAIAEPAMRGLVHVGLLVADRPDPTCQRG